MKEASLPFLESDENRTECDRLASIRRTLFCTSTESGIRQMNPELGQWFIQMLQSNSPHDQAAAIIGLKTILKIDALTPNNLPGNFFSVFCDVFFDDDTDFRIKMAMLNLINSMCDKNEDLVHSFTNCCFYSRLFSIVSSPRPPFKLSQWLPVINYFLKLNAVAFYYFASKHRLLQFLQIQLQDALLDIDFYVIVETLSVFASSQFFNPFSDPEAVYELVHISLSILSSQAPNLVSNAIKIMSSCLYKLPEGPHIDELIKQRISVIIMKFINSENLQLSFDCVLFLSLATYCSDSICVQLAECDIFIYLSAVLLCNEDFFQTCAFHSLSSIFNFQLPSCM